MENNKFQFHPDIQHEEEKQQETVNPAIYMGAENSTEKKKKNGGIVKKIISCVLVLFLAGGAGFGGALAAVYVAPQILPPTITRDNIAIQTDANINTAEAVADKVKPSVVGISAYSGNNQTQSLEDFFNMPSGQPQSSVGTGLIFTESGYILTNSHVVLDGEASKITVQLPDGKELDGKVLWNDVSSDLAIVKVEEENLIPAVLGDSEEVKVGSYAVAIGNPLGLAFDRSVTQGIISGLSRTIQIQSQGATVQMDGLIQTDASINGGNSGGPLCNSEGEVIGINTAQAKSGEGLGFAIPINIAKPIVEEIIKTGEFERSYMGIKAISVADVLKSYPNEDFGTKTGAIVSQVYTDSPASKAGMKEGDVIVGIDDLEVETMSQMIKELFAYRPGDEITVKIIREKKPMELKMVLSNMSSVANQ